MKKRLKEREEEEGLCTLQLKQARIDTSSFHLSLTQQRLDNYVTDYIADCVLSINHVDSIGFKTLIQRLTGGRFAPRCRQTVTTQLEEKFACKKRQLIDKLKTVDSVCTTADGWTSRRRSFLGVTVHWLDPESLERKGGCLAIRQLSGRHTYDILAKTLESINTEFDIAHKTCYTVTDSGANFVKAFRHFASVTEEVQEEAEAEVQQHENENDVEDETEIEFTEINYLLVPTAEEVNDNDQVIYQLPPHRKCACHLLNLVATADAGKIDGVTKRTSTQTFAKLQGMWNKQNRSPNVAEEIKNELGCLLITPGDTRWNSTYDAMCKVNSIIVDAKLEAKFDKLCDKFVSKRLLPAQKTFIGEYVQVMAPVCCGLDILQGEKCMGLGYLVPTLSIMKNTLHGLLERTGNDTEGPKPLTICQPLVQALLNGIEARFGDMFGDTNAKLAAAVHPKFKLDWLDSHVQKIEITEALKRAVSREIGEHDQTETQQAAQSAPPVENDFFASITARRLKNATRPDAESEVEKYLGDSSSELSSLQRYPTIRKLFLKLNTGLPSSSAVERLFSLGGKVFTPLRSRLSSKHFEMMVFLRSCKST